jgi:transcription antitermination protein NusB
MQSTRRVIRIKVLQALYAYEIAKDPIEKVKKDILSDLEDKEKYKFASDLIDNVLKNVDSLDKMIIGKIENWEFERIALIDKLVLRMGLAEMLYFPEIPPKVSINESIEIAKNFCTNQSGKFVNGILDSILNDLKKDNTLNKQGRGLLDLKKK